MAMALLQWALVRRECFNKRMHAYALIEGVFVSLERNGPGRCSVSCVSATASMRLLNILSLSLMLQFNSSPHLYLNLNQLNLQIRKLL